VTIVRVLWSRFLGVIGRRHRDEDLEAEIRTHLEMLEAKYVRDGLSIDAARAAARREFGGVEQTKDAYRDHRGWRWFEDAQRDLRYTLRSLARARGFAAVVVITLGLGIGAATAVFSVVNAVVLRPLKAPGADRLVRSLFVVDGRKSEVSDVNTLKVWKDLSGVFEDVSAHRLDSVSVIGTSEPEQLSVGRVSEPFFRLFSARVVAGRVFTPDEDCPNGPAVAILSHALWMRRFGGESDVVGRTIALGSVPHLIVGILSPDFDSEQFEPLPDVWVPLQTDPEHVDGGSIYQITARIRPGVTHAAANAALAVEHDKFNSRRSASDRSRRPGAWIAESLQTAMAGDARSSLNVLLGAVAFLLLIACANVANLLLVRADVRRREMVIRASIGAGPHRIVRQLLVEALTLSLMGGAVGLAVGVLATRSVLRLAPGNNPFMLGILGVLPRIGESGAAVSVDWRVWTFAILVSVGTGLAFGLVPARQFGRSNLQASLVQASAGPSIAGRRMNAPATFVIAEIALAVILVVGAALLLRTSIALREVDPGFAAEQVLTMRMAVSGTGFDTRDGISELTRVGVEKVQAIPGVVRASTTCCMPLETVWQLPFVMASRAGQGLTQMGSMRFHGFAGWTFVSPGYFEVFRIPILKGRDFTFADNAKAPGVVIINEAMARRYWPKSDPLEDRLVIGRGMRVAYDEEPVRQIIGVVGNVRDTGLRDEARPAMYVPVAQEPDGVTVVNVKLLPVVWIVRTATPPYALGGQIKKALESSPGRLPVTRIRALTDVVSESTARTRFNTSLMSAFGFCALGLAAIGVYGLVAYWVQRRSREIGIRLALGAEPSGIAMMVVKQGMRLVAVGVGIGMIAALGLAQLIRGLLFGVAPRDPVVFISIPLLLALVALGAVAVPAWRASRFDPLETLRSE
jgi:putative ABC transport system permease protein